MTRDTVRLAGSPGPHVFVDDLEVPALSADDDGHLRRSLRMRAGDPLTISDSDGRWCCATMTATGLETTSEVFIEPDAPKVTVGFSLVKGQKPEFVIQKLTELGVDHIVALQAERSIVRWDEHKVGQVLARWERIAREASMQSHRCRLPVIEGVLHAGQWLAASGSAIAHFDGDPLADVAVSTLAIGPEGGWSPKELQLASGPRVSLGRTVLRAETASIAAATLLVSTP